jgi:flavin reductase (DIM6/NTAB) family NADH-FMN oxidoreductase RutF
VSLPQRPENGTAALGRCLEAGGEVSIQWVPPDAGVAEALGGATRPGVTVDAPCLDQAYLIYEARPARPGRDFSGATVLASPTCDIGDHRTWFFEITAIQLRLDLARGTRQILWRSLPAWSPRAATGYLPGGAKDPRSLGGYTKPYAPHYRFPSAATAAFEADIEAHGMAVKLLPPLPEDQVEVDDDRARWPCFFPSSLGLITTWDRDGRPNLMPCGSTTVLSRTPLVLAPCVSYAPINQRYAPRETLRILRERGRFGCGVPYINERMIEGIQYAGSVSLRQDSSKVAHAGFAMAPDAWAPRILAAPIHYECEVVDEIGLGTHAMFLGEVRRTVIRDDLSPDNPLEWYPWPTPGDLLPAA